MAKIKVSTSIFSLTKSINRALQKATIDDEIVVKAGTYNDTLIFHEDSKITGKSAESVLLKGSINIAKTARVLFENMTIQPNTPIIVEGHITFKNCVIEGGMSSLLLSLNNGTAHCEHTQFINASEIAIAMLHESKANFDDCFFDRNKKVHLLIDNSTVHLNDCELSNANQAIWVKSKAKAFLHQIKIHQHKGAQIIVEQESLFQAIECSIKHGEGNGIYASEHSKIHLTNCTVSHHTLPQVWMQKSTLELIDCEIQHGNESGVMLKDYSEAIMTNCLIAFHKIANVQVSFQSLLNMTNSKVYSCQGVGIQLKEKSIANFSNTIFAYNVLPQLFITENSICTLKNATIKDGSQIAVFTEKGASCSIVSSLITGHKNTALTAIDAELFLLDTTIQHNKGNGILAIDQAKVLIENCLLTKNDLAHIAGKNQSMIEVSQSELTGGKSIYVIDHCQLDIIDSIIKDGTGVQIEVIDNTKATIQKSQISGGQTNGIKVMKDTTLHIFESQISAHKLPQIVVNDSSIIFKNSELLEGERNGFIIENNAEAFIQDSFISNHVYPQIWIDCNSSVELNATQLTKGHESDIYVQNQSNLHASSCIIHNDKFNFNIQAVNFSNIQLSETIVENSFGNKFYSENNSHITFNLDEIS